MLGIAFSLHEERGYLRDVSSCSHLLGSAAQVDPLAQARGEALDALGHQEDVVAHEPAQGHRVDGAVQFRQRVQHDALQPGDAVPRPRREILHARQVSSQGYKMLLNVVKKCTS